MKEGARLIPVSEATVVASSSTFVKETESDINLLSFARNDISLRHHPLLGRNLKPINYG